jgi:hypothetical protein
VARYSDRECLGALGATLSLRRFGFSETTTASQLVEKDGVTTMRVERALRLENGALGVSGNRRAHWRVETGSPSLVVSRPVAKRLEMKVPEGTVRVRVLPGALGRYQGVLYTYDAKGEVKDQAQASSSYSSGFGADAAPAPLRDGFLALEEPCGGCTLVFEPFLTEDSQSTPPRLEITLPADDAKVKTSLDGVSLTNWAAKETKMITATLSLPVARPAALADLTGDVWSLELVAPMTLVEGNANDVPTAGALALNVADFSFRVPLPLR